MHKFMSEYSRKFASEIEMSLGLPANTDAGVEFICF
jgi:hypothetical protein